MDVEDVVNAVCGARCAVRRRKEWVVLCRGKNGRYWPSSRVDAGVLVLMRHQRNLETDVVRRVTSAQASAEHRRAPINFPSMLTQNNAHRPQGCPGLSTKKVTMEIRM